MATTEDGAGRLAVPRSLVAPRPVYAIDGAGGTRETVSPETFFERPPSPAPAALTVPDLAAGATGVVEDGAHAHLVIHLYEGRTPRA